MAGYQQKLKTETGAKAALLLAYSAIAAGGSYGAVELFKHMYRKELEEIGPLPEPPPAKNSSYPGDPAERR